jgi:glutamate racemase
LDGIVEMVMNTWDSEDEAERRTVYPARDAERSAHAFFDYPKGDPRNTPQEGLSLVHERQLAPIGLFDSGVGGLTILSALRQELPNEHYIFFGDTAHCPYGTRSEANIIELSLQACQFLMNQGVKLLVVACNTASQVALNTLRTAFPIPIVGIVPAVKPAARATKRGRIGIAATNRTVQTAYLQRLVDEFASDIEVYAVGCPELVALVERGELEGPRVEKVLLDSLQPLLAKDVDVIVLGCTHFPAIRPSIERVVGKRVQIIDSGAAIARRTHSVLDTEGLVHPSYPEKGTVQIWCSGDTPKFEFVASKVLGYPVVVHQVIR